jgi:hypothetical protein
VIALVVVAVGAALLTAGLVALFGPAAAVGCGFALIVAGVLIDWEAVLHGKHLAPPSR